MGSSVDVSASRLNCERRRMSRWLPRSRYPSAYGHTPSYRSLGRDVPGYPSALYDTDPTFSRYDPYFDRKYTGRVNDLDDAMRFERFKSRASDIEDDMSFGKFKSRLGNDYDSFFSDFSRDFADMKSSMWSDSLFSPSRRMRTSFSPDPWTDSWTTEPLHTKKQSMADEKVSSYRSSEYRSSEDGGKPHKRAQSEFSHRNTKTGDSGIPHTTYSHSSSNYDSDRPYANRHVSYNI